MKLSNKKGFTLVELLMVVIIIGILVTVAVPGYLSAMERSKASKAKANLDVMRKAIVQVCMIQGNYGGAGDATALEAETTAQGVDFNAAAMDSDTNWTYSINAGGTDVEFEVQADRVGGKYDGQAITVNQDGEYVIPAANTEWL